MAAKVSTLASLQKHYLHWLETEVAAGRSRPRTLDYYRAELGSFVSEVGGRRKVETLIAWDLESRKRGWHRVQAVQRLFNWGVAVGILSSNPFAGVKRPRRGERTRVLDRLELIKLLRGARRPLRDVLQAQRYTLARPQEPRQLIWANFRPDLKAFVLDDFKGKGMRADGARFRVLPIAPRLERLLLRLQRRSASPDAHVFLNTRGNPWKANALSLAVRRLCDRLGLNVGQGERVVPYTLRHTAATLATANGVSDRLLAELLGHASTETTARYQHLSTEHLRRGVEAATRPHPPDHYAPPKLGLVG